MVNATYVFFIYQLSDGLLLLSACSSGKISKSHVVSAMGYGNLCSNSVRISFPPNDAILKSESLITTKELDRLARCWSNL